MLPQYLFEYPNMHSDFPFYIKEKQHTDVPMHRHDFIELLFVLEGEGTEWINGHAHTMKSGTVVLLLPYQFHSIQADPKYPLKMIICNFDMTLIFAGREAELGLFQLVFNDEGLSPYVQSQGTDLELIKASFQNMLTEYNDNKMWKQLLIQANILEALTRFDRLRRQSTHVEKPVSKIKKTDRWEIIRYVYDHYLQPLSLVSLGHEFKLNPVQVSEMIKERLGIGFAQFIQELRVRHACSLLKTTDLPVFDVAIESGFGSFQTFFRIFKKMKGTTPGSYRSLR
ncbi:AraC family transcriptional regulator [Paenibacillus qinlingensis]|uniref:AraC-like DNA-binding protein n=1 Tax=Paenibacillus qinlingensis TaxID=1837343 RepID=A0ABU1NS57_9BACL|nr:AraC family transcriptional regulator [Paenibacillus qinlingensis]MDR6550314.1 AraC-like DNA-binding protein [Paenibacillus qinlingensis]